MLAIEMIFQNGLKEFQLWKECSICTGSLNEQLFKYKALGPNATRHGGIALQRRNYVYLSERL